MKHSEENEKENGQIMMFSDSECDSLQEIVKENLRDDFESTKYIFAEEEAEPFTADEESICRGKMQNDLFDVEPLVTENHREKAEKEKKQLEKEIEEANKKMILPYFSKPKNDNEKLFNYQYDFIKNGDQTAWGNLLLLSLEVTKKLIWQWLSEHPGQYLDDIAQDEKASIAVEYVLRRYKHNPGWHVTKNYIGALKGGVIHAMCYTTKIDKDTYCVEDVNLERTKNRKKK